MNNKGKMQDKTRWQFITFGILAVVVLGFAEMQFGLVSSFISGLGVGAITGAVSGDLGDPSTVTLIAYDMASGTKTALAGSTINATVYQNDVAIKEYTTWSVGASSLSLAVGDNVIVQEFDPSYYGALGGTPTSFSVNSEAFGEEIMVYAHGTETSFTVTCYDAGTVLDAGQTLVGNDYNVTLGASEEKEIYCTFKNNQADKVWDLCGLAIRGTNDADDITITNAKSDGVWNEVTVPKHLKDSAINTNGTAADNYNYTGYEKMYRTTTPIRMLEWEEATVYMVLKAGSTDPSYTATLSDVDGYFIQAKDCDSFSDKTGTPAYGLADDSDDQADAGIDEPDASPAGKTSGVFIGAI